MSTIANLLIRVGVDTNDAARNLSTFGGRAGAGLRKAFLPAIGVLTGLGLAAKAGFDEFKGSEQVIAQTNAVLRSTGGIANVTAGHVGDLAQALMRKSGVDDDVIQSGANVILTFTRIRNEVGKGNNIFDRATQAALDMSVALGQDMKSSSIQVGKALNDPLRGLTSLTRAGVQFTDAQKTQIKAMVDSGNTMGAQKIILRELETQFGGSAAAAGKTLAGQLRLAENTFKNLAASIVSAVMPAFLGFAGVVNSVLAVAQRHTTATKVVIGVIGGLAAAVVAANVAMRVWAAGVVIATAAKGAATAATKVWTAAQWALNAALRANPIGIVITLVAALAAGIIVAWRQSDTFRSIATAAFNAVRNAASAVVSWIKANWPLLLTILTGPIGLAVTAIVGHWGRVKGAVQAVKDAISTVVGAVASLKNSPALQAIDNTFGAVFGAVKSLINSVADAINNVIGKLQSAVSWANNLAGKVASVVGKVGSVVGKIPGFATGTNHAPGGLALVGERGPELVDLPRGSRVIPNNRIGSYLAQDRGGSGPTVHIDTMVVQDATDVDRVAARLGRQLMMAGA